MHAKKHVEVSDLGADRDELLAHSMLNAAISRRRVASANKML
jgi:hypothetical protein